MKPLVRQVSNPVNWADGAGALVASTSAPNSLVSPPAEVAVAVKYWPA